MNDYLSKFYLDVYSRKKACYLDSSGYEESGIYNHFLYRNALEYVDIYTSFDNENVKKFAAVVIPTSIDEIYLNRNAQVIKNYLFDGGVVVSFAQNFLEWLPGNNFYIPSDLSIKDRLVLESSHKIFAGIREYDLNYRRGVKGFFNRGYVHPPLGAEVILQDNEGKCVAYIDRKSTNGVILSTAGADLLGFGVFDNNTARKMGLGLLEWIGNEIGNKQEQTK